MKKKAALLLAILALGVLMAACGQSETSEPAPTATPEATEEPAASPDPTSSPETQQVNQEAESQNTSDESDSYAAESSADYETLVSEIMTEFGFSREKAEEIVQSGLQAAAEEQQRLEESSAAAQERIEKEKAEAAAETDSYWMDRYGITAKEAMGLSPEELRELRLQHQGG